MQSVRYETFKQTQLGVFSIHGNQGNHCNHSIYAETMCIPVRLHLSSLVFVWDLKKEMICRTKTHTTHKLPYRTVDVGACKGQHPKIIQRAVHSCLEPARRGLKTAADILNSCKMYLTKCNNKCIELIRSLVFPYRHPEPLMFRRS
jgi:hypothetical protein